MTTPSDRCPRCPMRSATRESAACHTHFGSPSGFDLHRRRDGSCLAPAAVGLVLSPTRRGLWVWPDEHEDRPGKRPSED